MRIALWIYIAAFVALSVWSNADPEMRDTPIATTIDVVLSAITLTGLVAYAIRLDAPRMIAAWKYIAPALLIAFIVQLLAEWPSLAARDPELTHAEQEALLAIAVSVVALFLAPAFIVNFRFAAAKHLDSGARG